MKNLIIILTCLFSITNLHSAESYNVGDTLFVWAKSGLNVRAEPSTKAKVLEKIPFGEQIKIAEYCEKAFYIKAVDTIGLYANYGRENETVGPLIFKGQWVKITTSSGKMGFVINQYLLHIEPYDKTNNSLDAINLELVKSDTISNSDIYSNENGIYSEVETYYDQNVTVTEISGDGWGETIYEFDGLSITEALVLFSSSEYLDLNECMIIRNWQNSIILAANDGFCNIEISWENDKTIINFSCSC